MRAAPTQAVHAYWGWCTWILAVMLSPYMTNCMRSPVELERPTTCRCVCGGDGLGDAEERRWVAGVRMAFIISRRSLQQPTSLLKR